MVDRQEVEALLEGTAEENGRADRHVPPATLAALCRAWLALDEAATGTVEAAGDDEAGQPRVLVHSTRDELAQGPSLACQRVRIVPEPSK